MTTINLDALDSLDALDGLARSGRPLMLSLDLVHEDPNQPRKTFDDAKQLELSASVAEGGVRVPVSVRPHPHLAGHYVLNFGARRRRAALSAGLSEIPAWIDERFSDFDQVIENVQRAELTPMEMALFVSDKLAGGLKAAEIARRLGIGRAAIAKYSALIGAPPEIEAVYTSGRSTSPDTIYELRAVFNRHPEEVRDWLTCDREVSRRSVEELRCALSEQEQPPEDVAAATKRKSSAANPNIIKRPVVAIKIGERLAILVLSRRPSRDDRVLVKWDDTADIEEVPPSDICVVRIDDARRCEPLSRGIPKAEAIPPPE
jgi:ParB family chromosome partitioning protein